jgi:Leucine-rich repeat (LRR) protein
MPQKTIEIVVNGGLIYATSSGINDDSEVIFHGKYGDVDKNRVLAVYLDKQDFTRVPAWLATFPNIETLRLWGKNLELHSSDVATILHGFKKLHKLILCGHFTRGLPDDMSGIEGLEELMIGSSGLTELPRALDKLEYLVKLWVSNEGSNLDLKNRFEVFPEVVLHLKNLRELEIADVDMVRFPASKVSELAALEKLDISKNPIAELPGWLFVEDTWREEIHARSEGRFETGSGSGSESQSEPGQTMDVRDVDDAWEHLGDDLDDFDEDQGGSVHSRNFRNSEKKVDRRAQEQQRELEHRERARNHEMQLRELDAHETRIARLPDDMSRWGKNLEVLDVSRTDLEALPDVIGECKRLRVLRAERTKLRVLPAAIGGCAGLEVLELGGSLMEALPDAIGECRALRILDVSSTGVQVIPASIGGCNQLRELLLSGTAVKTLPAELARCTNLRLVSHKHLHRSSVPPVVWNMPGVAFIKDEDYSLPSRCPVDWENRWD